MLSLLYLLGLLLGIVGVVIAVATVVIVAGAVLAWLNGLVLRARINDREAAQHPQRSLIHSN